eukprot:TRINITY_DN1148_c0_g1_i5.p1 TRINITY_DN1148_c0_g1~~TRINITY_DN1148_c0_g1_i5.p1  ORF type:complete len:197 (+),score=32.98 TRINITY_DN1148_c0_g1_i5:1-591(+)
MMHLPMQAAQDQSACPDDGWQYMDLGANVQGPFALGDWPPAMMHLPMQAAQDHNVQGPQFVLPARRWGRAGRPPMQTAQDALEQLDIVSLELGEKPTRIFVKTPAGMVLAVDADLSQSAASLMQQLKSSQAAQFGEGQYVLHFRRRHMPSNLTLQQCGVEIGNVLHASRVVARAPPGAGAKTFRRRAFEQGHQSQA